MFRNLFLLLSGCLALFLCEKGLSQEIIPDPKNPTGDVSAYRQFLIQAEAYLKQADGAENARKILEICPKEYRNFEWHFLYGKARRVNYSLKGHKGRVNAAAFSPDGKTLASASRDETVKLWDTATGKVGLTFKGHDDAVYCVAFHPQGKTLASGSRDGTIKLWDVSTGKNKVTLTLNASCAGLSFSPNGAWLASYSRVGDMQIWDVAKAKAKDSWQDPGDNVKCLAFSPDGKILASGNADGGIRVWSIPDFQLLKNFKAHSDLVTDLAFNPDGQRLFTAGLDGIRIWQFPEVKHQYSLTDSKETPSRAIACSMSGTAIATIGENGIAKVWHEPLEKPTHYFDAPLTSFVTFSPNGRTLALEGPGNTVQLYDLAEESILLRTPEPVWSILPGNDHFLVSMRTGAAAFSITSSSNFKPRPVLRSLGQVRTLAMHPQGRLLASAGPDGVVKIWDPQGNREHHSLEGHQKLVRALAFSPDGKHLASASEDKTIKIWDAVAGREVRTLRGHKGIVTSVHFLPATDLLVSAGGDGTIRVWQTLTGKNLRTWTAHEDIVSHLALAADGKRLASAGTDRTIKIWDLDSGKALHALPVQSSLVQGLAFSPNGKRLASGTMFGGVTLWDTAAGQAVYTFPRTAGPVNAVAFSPDGTCLYSGSYDGTVMLWKAKPAE